MGGKNNIINTLVASGFIPNNVAALDGKCTLLLKKRKEIYIMILKRRVEQSLFCRQMSQVSWYL